MPISTLSLFQFELWRAFDRRAEGFFLTGGAALAFKFGHRTTEDLDLATFEQPLSVGAEHLHAAARDIGAVALEERMESLGGREQSYRRFEVTRDAEWTKVDLLLRDPPRHALSTTIDGFSINALEQILVDKLVLIVSRARQEPRDLIDIVFLLRAGCHLEQALELVRARIDTPGQLRRELAGWHIPTDAPLPRGVTIAEIEEERRKLIERLP